MKNIFGLLHYLKPYKGLAALNVLFNILSVFFSLFSVILAVRFLEILFGNEELVTNVGEFELNAKSVQEHFNYYMSQIIINQGKMKALLVVSLITLAASFMRNVTRYLALFFMTPIRFGISRDMRNKIFNKILQLPLRFFGSSRRGDIIARMTGDVQEIEASILSSIEMIFRDPITIIIYLVALLSMSPKLTIFIFVLLPVSAFILGRIGKSLRKTSFRGQKKMGFLLSVIEETLGGMRIIKGFNAEDKVDNHFKKHNQEYTRIMNRMQRRRYAANPLSEFMGTVVMISVMYYGGSLVLGQSAEMNPEDLIGYLMLFYFIITPAKGFATAYYNIQKGMASIERVDMILDAKNEIYEIEKPNRITEFKDYIEYKNVTFRYKDVDVLKNINLKIEKGKTVALVGHSGSGKSTLADLLPRFYDVQHGDIVIDGVSIKEYKIEDLRNLMGIVSQESILFNDTFYNNIAFGVKETTLEDVKHAAEIANAHEFIKDYEEEYETNIGDRGTQLSGGQRQRVSIARAVLKNPPILILDEATSALDTESERLVQDAIIKLMENRTSLVIAHRLSTIKHADEICVMEGGEIIERGTHDELITKNGAYKKLHDMQTQ